MIKRLFDIISSVIGLILFSPFFVIISVLVLLSSKGGVFYRQTRVGKGREEFKLLKFRSMKQNSDKTGQITVGTNDVRITGIGKVLRKLKLDEIPQLINVIKGEMSIVGPRPEVPKYVKLYSEKQLKVLEIRPGLTDLASIEYINENEILGKSENPEEEYINIIIPKKLNLNLQYIENRSFFGDLWLIVKTLGQILK